MNVLQKRLLIVAEFEFYRLGASDRDFKVMLSSLGYKPEPDLSKLSDEALQRLNQKVRTYLRKPTTS